MVTLKILKGPLILDGWWGQESALVGKDCILYRLKKKVIQTLKDNGYVNPSDENERNNTAHIKLCDRMIDPRDQSVFNLVNGKMLELGLSDITINRHYIEIRITNLYSTTMYSQVTNQLHMNLYSKTNIGNYRSSILPLIANVITDLYNELVNPPIPIITNVDINDIDDTLCVICIVSKKNIWLNCGHVCMCQGCASNVITCPLCRAQITVRNQAFI